MTRAKKWLALMLATLMVFATTPLSVFAAEEPVVTIDVADTADRGDEITVTVHVTAADVTAIGIRIADSFDSDAFDFVSAEWLVDGKIANVDTDKLYAVYAADLNNTLAADGAVFRYTLAVKDAAAYGAYVLTPSVVIEAGDKTTVDPSASITLVKSPSSYFKVAEDFESATNDTYAGGTVIGCSAPFGKAVSFARDASVYDNGPGKISGYDVIQMGGNENAEAIAFYYDATKATANVAIRFVPIDRNNRGECIETKSPVTTIIDGVLNENNTSLINGNFVMTFTKGTAGWVIMDISKMGHHDMIGAGPNSSAEVTAFGVCVTNTQSVLLDQFSYVEDVAAFTALATADSTLIPGYVAPGHNWVDGVCSKCNDSVLTIAQNFESATDESYVNGVTADCGSDFGKSVMFSYTANLGSGTTSNDFQHIAFDAVGTAYDEALVFYYDNTTSGKPAVLYYAPVNAAGAGTTVKTGHPLTIISDGKVDVDNTTAAYYNYSMRLPANSSGWVMLSLGRNNTGSWSLWGGAHCTTTAGISAFAVRTDSDTEVVLDQFGFVKNMDVFAAYAVDNTKVEGYTGKHNWKEATCTEPKICKDCATIEGEALGHDWKDRACARCGEKQPLETLYTVGYDFESELSDVYIQYPCVSPYGMAGKIAFEAKATTVTPFTTKGSDEDQALVMWVSAKDKKVGTTNNVQFFVYCTAVKDESQTTVSNRPQRPAAGTYTTINTDGQVGSVTGIGSHVSIPGGFEGWIVFPFTDFEEHWGTHDAVDLKPGTMVNVTYQDGNIGMFYDQIGFTTDAEAFINFLSGVKADSGHNWQDNVCTNCGGNLLTVVEDCEDVSDVELSGSNTTHGVVSVDGNEGVYGKALKWFRGSTNDGVSNFTLPLTAGKITDEALYFYVNAEDQLAASPGYTLYVNMINGNTNHHATAGKPYYFVDANGVVTQKTFSGHTFSVDKGTSGWIVVPVTSFNGKLTANNVQNLYFSTGTNLNNILYLDSFGYAVDLNDAITAFSQQAQVEHLGTSYNDKGNALRFGFTLKAAGITLDNYQRNIENATVTVNGETYKLVSFGAIISNKADAELTIEYAEADGKRTKKIEANLLLDYSDDTAYFTCGIKNIPDNKQDAPLYARSYYVYLDNAGNEVVVYGYEYVQNLAARKLLDNEVVA